MHMLICISDRIIQNSENEIGCLWLLYLQSLTTRGFSEMQKFLRAGCPQSCVYPSIPWTWLMTCEGFPCLCMLKGLLQLCWTELGASERESSCQEFLFSFLPTDLVRQPKFFLSWEENHPQTQLLHWWHPEADAWLELLVPEYETPDSTWVLINQSHLPLYKKQGEVLL